MYIEKNIFVWHPSEIITDYETGLRKAVMDKFPKSNLRGCWFHYCKAIRSKCNQLGIRPLLSRSSEAKKYYRQIMDLPLLPASDIENGFSYIERSIKKNGLYADFQELLKYFRNYWLKQVCSCSFVSINIF